MGLLSETLKEWLLPYRDSCILSNQGIFWGFQCHLIWISQSYQMPLSPLGRDLYLKGLHFEAHHHP
jgi:hypothetical protein